jgi:hypothetical protein
MLRSIHTDIRGRLRWRSAIAAVAMSAFMPGAVQAQEPLSVKKIVCEAFIVYVVTQSCQNVDVVDKITGLVKTIYKCVSEKIPQKKEVCKEVTVPAPPQPHFPKPGVQQ